MIQTLWNGTRLQTDSLEDPSSTAIPFATHAQAVAGETGTNPKKRLKGITDCHTGKDKDAMRNEW
jgi:hypothetical protein